MQNKEVVLKQEPSSTFPNIDAYLILLKESLDQFIYSWLFRPTFLGEKLYAELVFCSVIFGRPRYWS